MGDVSNASWHFADLLGLLHDDDAVPNRDHALLAVCIPEDLGTVDQSATRLAELCRVRARQLMDVSARMADSNMDNADVRVLLDHACAALDEAEHWSALAASARYFRQNPRQARQAAQAIAASWPMPDVAEA